MQGVVRGKKTEQRAAGSRWWYERSEREGVCRSLKDITQIDVIFHDFLDDLSEDGLAPRLVRSQGVAVDASNTFLDLLVSDACDLVLEDMKNVLP